MKKIITILDCTWLNGLCPRKQYKKNKYSKQVYSNLDFLSDLNGAKITVFINKKIFKSVLYNLFIEQKKKVEKELIS